MKTRVIVFSEKMLGDIVVQSTAAINIRLNAPGAHIVLSCPPQFEEPLKDCGVWDEIWPFSRKAYKSMSFLNKIIYSWNFVRKIRRAGFTHAIIFDGYDRAALFAFLARIPIRAGLAQGFMSFTLTHKYHKTEGAEDFRNFYLGTTRAAGFAIQTKRTGFVIRREAELAVSALLKRKGLRRGSYVAIHLGASDDQRRWPAEKFRQLLEILARRKPSLRFIFIAGPGEDEMLRSYEKEISEKFLRKKVHFVARCSFQQAAALLAAAKLVLAFDSSPRHLAAALGVRTLAFISDWKLKSWKLYDETENQFIVVGHGIEPRHGIQGITVNEVSKALRKLLS